MAYDGTNPRMSDAEYRKYRRRRDTQRETRHIIRPTGHQGSDPANWLSDIFDYSAGGKEAVCSICKDRFKGDYYRATGVYPVCIKCKGVHRTSWDTKNKDKYFEAFMDWNIPDTPYLDNYVEERP